MAPTPIELSNYVGGGGTGQGLPAADSGGFYRKTPGNPKAAMGGGGRLDLDVPAFLRKQGGHVGGGRR